jgi:hypothetical protein
MYTGAVVWPLDPRPDDIKIADVAHHLSNLCRFTGGTRKFYSVAQHSCHVADALGPCDPSLAAWGLLHDASEAYLGDIARPTKHAVAGFGEAYRQAEDRLMRVIAERFGLHGDEPDAVKDVDDRMVVTEARDLMPGKPPFVELEFPDVQPYDWSVRPWTPDEAKTEFLLRFRVLLAQGAVRP